MRIDAHQHYWRYRPADLPWIDGRMQRIARDFLPPDLEPELRAHDFDGSIAVQARQDPAETAFLLELAERHPSIRGVVGWVDLCADDVHRALERAATGPLRGLRHIAQDEPDGFLARPDFRRGIAALAGRDLVYDVLVYARQLPAALALVRAFPQQQFVLDHLAKPAIARGEREPWATQLRELARCDNVACKLSGLVTEAQWHGWRAGDLHPWLDVALAAFGERRVLYGSDWPVCLLAATDYRSVFDVVRGWAERLTPTGRDLLFGGNAARIYRLA